MILCLSQVKHLPEVWETLSSIGNVKYLPDVEFSRARHAILQHSPTVLFVNPNSLEFRVDERLLSSSLIKVICTASTGTNHIDKDYCRKNDIKIISITTEYDVLEKVTSTAEMAFGLLLSTVRFIPQSFDSVKNRQWDCMNFLGRQLNGMRMGVIGYGRLGKMMAKYCDAFGMNVAVCDPFKKTKYQTGELRDICQWSEAISLHVHLNESTKGLINDSIIDEMSGVYLVNTSRGEVVDESAVLRGLEKGNLSGYGADVIVDELGNVENSEIISKSTEYNIVITPHIGGATKEAQTIAYKRACDLLDDYLRSD